MKKCTVASWIAASVAAASAFAAPYCGVERLPDLVKCLPAPPEPGSADFSRDLARYAWGKEQRKDPRRAALAKHDSVWSYETIAGAFSQPFGMELSATGTPAIWKLLEDSLSTADQMRVAPKAFYRRRRPFAYFGEEPLCPEEDGVWRNEGSYPSGHTMRSMVAALILAEINPENAVGIFVRAMQYGENRVIAGAHWQSDVDMTRVAAAIAYSRLQAIPAFRSQMRLAKCEFAAHAKNRPAPGGHRGSATASNDGDCGSEADLPRLEALAFDVDGSTIYVQILVPSRSFSGKRPCAILCHGFAGFTRWDDVAHDLCRAGIAVVVPHHRGAWGSEGEYTVSGCIRDAGLLAAWAMGGEFSGKYGTGTNAVYIIGHSMGGNTAVNAGARLEGIRGIALVAPCDIGSMAAGMTDAQMADFLVGEGMHALKRKSDKAIVDDIYANAAKMRFADAAGALSGKKVFLATGEYDTVVPAAPLDVFWAALGGDSAVHVRKRYRAGHSLMGARQSLAKDLIDFILD